MPCSFGMRDRLIRAMPSRRSVPDLNIRTGPGTDYPRSGMFTGIGTFTIVEVKDGKGSSEGWGRLKSGAGWIALSLVKRV